MVMKRTIVTLAALIFSALGISASLAAPDGVNIQLPSPITKSDLKAYHAASQPKGPRELDKVVAIVGDDIVTESELNHRFQLTKKQLERAHDKLPSNQVLKKQVLNQLIDTKIELNTAKKAGVDVDEDEGFLDFAPIEADDDVPSYDTVGEGDRGYPSYTFPAGAKTLEVYHNQMGTLWRVKFREGGELPAILKGQFTDEKEAIKAVETYLANKED